MNEEEMSQTAAVKPIPKYDDVKCPLKMNRNQLKYLLIIAMLIDHIAWAFVPTNKILPPLAATSRTASIAR